MSPFVQALLFALGALSLGAHVQRRSHLLWWGTGLLATLLLASPLWPLGAPPLTVLPGQGALLLTLAAGWLLGRDRPAAALAVAGFCCAQWITSLLLTGLPVAFATLPLVASALTFWLALHRPDFAQRTVLAEAKVLLLILALASSVLPDLADGWRSASALQSLGQSEVDEPSSRASLLVATLCLLAGLLYTRWKYR